MKKFALASFAAFVTIALTDFLIHQVGMKSMYAETAALWRTPEEMQGMMALMPLGQLVTALFFVTIFRHGYRGTGIAEGMRCGLLLAGLHAGGLVMMHVVHPYPMAMTLAWTFAVFAQCAVIGAVVAAVWGKQPGRA